MLVDFSSISRDYYGNIEQPVVTLKTPHGSVISVIPANSISMTCRYNDVSEVQFTVPAYIEGQKVPSYDEISGLRLVEIGDFGDFVLINPEKTNEGGIKETLQCTAYSLEYVFNYKKVDLGIEEDVNTYEFYNQTDNTDTIMGMIIEAAPDWSIGYVDQELIGRYRYFDNTDDNWYSFMMNTLQEAYNCVFLFDTKNKSINVISTSHENTNLPIFLSYNNLLKTVNVTELSEEIVTSLAGYGSGDEVSIRDVNPNGTDKIYNLDFFLARGDLTGELADKWRRYKESCKTNYEVYSVLNAAYREKYSQLLTAEAELIALQTDYEAVDAPLKINQELVLSETDEINKEILENQIAQQKVERNTLAAKITNAQNVINDGNGHGLEIDVEQINSQLDDIVDQCSLSSFFTHEELTILSQYFIEDAITESSFVLSEYGSATSEDLYQSLDSTAVPILTVTDSYVYASDAYTIIEDPEGLDLDPAMQATIIEQLNNDRNKSSLEMRGGKFQFSYATIDSAGFQEHIISGDIVNVDFQYNVTNLPTYVDEDSSDMTKKGYFIITADIINGSIDDTPYPSIHLVMDGMLGENDPVSTDTSLRVEMDHVVYSCTGSVTELQKQDVLKELYDYTETELKKLSEPSYEFNIDSANFLFADKFEPFKDALKLGDTINLVIDNEEEEVLEPILIEVSFDFEDETKLELTFSDKYKKSSPQFKLADLITEASHSARSVNLNKASYSSYKDSNTGSQVRKMRDSALDVSKNKIQNAVNQNLEWNQAGMFLRKTNANGTVDPKQIGFINDAIVFTRDNWDTIEMAIGSIYDPNLIGASGDNDDGVRYGIAAPAIYGTLLAGENLVIENTILDPQGGEILKQFKVDATGAWLNNSSLVLANDSENGGKMFLDPKYGFAAGTQDLYTLQGTEIKPSFIDEDGEIIMDETETITLPDGTYYYVPKNAQFYFDINTGNAYFAGNINARNIMAGTLNGMAITANTLDGSALIANTVNGDKITTNTLSGEKLQDLAITSSKIANSTITGSKIANSTITGSNIANTTITASNIVDGTITGTKIADATITGENVLTGTITGGHLAQNTITDANIERGTITGAAIASGTITGTNIQGGSITGTEIDDSTITSSHIVDGTITGTDIDNATITGGNIAQTTITDSNIVRGTITGAAVASATITGSNIAGSTITGTNIDFSTFSNGVISGTAIDTSTFTNGSIDASAIDASSFTNGSISGSAIDTSTFTNGQISGTKIDTSTFTNGSISGSVIDSSTLTNIPYAGIAWADITAADIDVAWIDTGMIKDAAITDAQILGVSANKLTAGTIDANKITVANLNAKNLIVETINGQALLGGSYNAVDKTSAGYASKVPSAENWYEIIDGEFVKSSDASVQANKTYYTLGQTSVTTTGYVDGLVDDLNDRIDGAIQTFTTDVVPTLNNYPAEDWTTTDLLDEHVGDVCYVVNAESQADGYCYRFTKKQNNTYEWTLIKDSDVTKALQDLITVQGDISGLKSFETSTTAWITNTDDELSSLKQRTSTLETDMGTKVDSTTFNTLSQTVDENSASITSLSTTVASKADSSTVTTLSNTVNTVSQKADANESAISQLTQTVSDNETDIEQKYSTLSQDLNGFKTTVGTTYATKTALGDLSDDVDAIDTRVTSAESSITQNANNIALKVSQDGVIASINASPESVTINANRVNIAGAAIFSEYTKTDDLDDTIAGLGYAQTSDAVAETQRIYISKTTTGSYTGPTTWVTATTYTANTWTTKRPAYDSSYPYLYTCLQKKTVNGTVTCTPVLLDDTTTVIDGGKIITGSITANQLAADAVKSTNYDAADSDESPYSVAGTLLDLNSGNIYSPNFGVINNGVVDPITGDVVLYPGAYINGNIVATSGMIGDDENTAWEIGSFTDYDANTYGSLISHGKAFLQSGKWMLSEDLLDTRWYALDNVSGGQKITYPYASSTYWDFGLHAPDVTKTTNRTTLDDSFLYIRNHASTIPSLDSEWNYVFRVDKSGMIYMNGQSLNDLYASKSDVGSDYLPKTGGTITGNLTVTGTITGTASNAAKTTGTLSINGKTFNGSADVSVGTLGVAYGGTGQTTANAAGNALIGAITRATVGDVTDNTTILTSTSTGDVGEYFRRPATFLWNYISSKLSSEDIYMPKTGGTFSGEVTFNSPISINDELYVDSASVGNLVVSGAGRFTNGLYGDLTGDVTGNVTGNLTGNVTGNVVGNVSGYSTKVLDSGNNTSEITFAYSKSGLSTTSWLAAWSGYELRAISPTRVKETLALTKSDVGLNNVDNTADAAKYVKGASITTELNSVAKYSDTSGTFTDSGIYIDENNNLVIGATDASTNTVLHTGNLKIGVRNDSYGLMPYANNWNTIGASNMRWYHIWGSTIHATHSDITNWWSNNNIGSPVTSSAAATKGKFNLYNVCAVGGTQTKTSIEANDATNSNISLILPSESGTFALTKNYQPYAHYSNMNGNNTGKYYKISINSTVSWMLNFTVKLYHAYRAYDLQISGYNYGSNYWYDPAAIILGSSVTDAIDVLFGYDSAYHLWVAIPAHQYTGIDVVNVSNGYAQIDSLEGLFTIEMVDGEPSTVQQTITAYRPWYRNETVTNATNAVNASKVNNHTVNADVPSNAKFTDTTYVVATNTADGLMSSDDKKKLDQINISDIGTIGANTIVGEKDIKVTITDGVATVGHANTAITAGTASGTSSTTNLAFGATVTLPSVTYDAYGHITGASTTTFKLPAAPTSVSGNAGTATQFSSAASVTLTGDTTGSASSAKGWSIATTTKTITPTSLTNVDLNNYKTTQKNEFYFGGGSNGCTNHPKANGLQFGLHTYASAAGHVTQELSSFGDSGSANHGKWIRWYNSSSWSGWEKFLTSSNYNDYAPSKTGTGATGTWNINAAGASKIVPKISKTYASTSYYATSTGSWETSTWYFMSVKPDSWYKPWRVKFKVHSFCPGYANVDSTSYCTVSGRAGAVIYSNWNERYDPAHYYMTCYPLKKAGFDAGYGNAIGVSILYGTGYNTAAYYRTFEVDYFECEGCTVTILDTPVQWANWTGKGTDNYESISSFNAVDRGMKESGDSDTIEDRQSYFAGKTSSSKGIWAASLFMEDGSGTYQNICAASDGTITGSNRTTATTKVANTSGFRIGSPIFYCNTNYNANTNIAGWGVVYNHISAFDSRYAFNTTLTANNLTPYAPVYLVGTIKSDNLFYLDTVWWTQTPTVTGKIYILVGGCYDSTTSNCRVSLHQHNPWYYYDGTRLVPYIHHAKTADTATSATTATTATNANYVNFVGGRPASADIMPSTMQNKVQFSLASSSMTTNKPPAGDGYITTYAWDNSNWGAQFYIRHNQTDPDVMVRGTNGSVWGNWKYLLGEWNYTDYTVTKTGTGASGTWGISVSGNAATATAISSSTWTAASVTNVDRYIWVSWSGNDGKPCYTTDITYNTSTKTLKTPGVKMTHWDVREDTTTGVLTFKYVAS